MSGNLAVMAAQGSAALSTQTLGVHISAQTSTAGGAVTTGSVTTTTGSTVFICAAVNAATFGATPVSDSKGNTWTLVGTALSIGTGPPDTETRIYSSTLATAGSAHTFTATPASGGFTMIAVQEVLGTGASPTIVSARQTDAATPFTSPTVSPSTRSVILGFIVTDAPSGTEVDTWGGSFVSGDKSEEVGNADTGVTGSIAAKVESASGTFNSSVTVAGVTVTHTGVWIVAIS